jgi:hypothetical protein
VGKCIYIKVFSRETSRERTAFGNRNKLGYNIKVDVKEIEWEGVALVCLTQDKDKWWAVISIVINLPVLQKAEKVVDM